MWTSGDFLLDFLDAEDFLRRRGVVEKARRVEEVRAAAGRSLEVHWAQMEGRRAGEVLEGRRECLRSATAGPLLVGGMASKAQAMQFRKRGHTSKS